MIAACPDEESKDKIREYCQNLELTNPQSSNEYHITLRYWPGYSELLDKVINLLEGNRSILEKFQIHPISMDIFGEDNSLVIRFEPSKLNEIYKILDPKLVQLGIPASDYPIYKPHLTIAEGVKQLPNDIPNFNINIDNWILNEKDTGIKWRLMHIDSDRSEKFR